MTKFLLPVLVVSLLWLGAGIALGEESTDGTAPENGAGSADDTGVRTGSDTDEAITQVPTYEQGSPFGVEEEERVTDSFFRIAQDFLYTSEIGARTVGHVPLWPRGPLKLGSVLLFPYLDAAIGWSSNVYQNDDSDQSWFMSAGAGLAGEYMFLGGRGTVTFGTDFRYRRYFNEGDNSTEWVTGLGIGYKFPRGWWIRGGVKWEHLNDPIRIEDQGEAERDQVYPYLSLGIDEVFGNKFNIEVGVDALFANYDEREFKTGDRREWDAYLKISYPFFRDQTRIYVRYNYIWADRRSRRINDLEDGHQVTGGIEGLFNLTQTGRLRGFIELGYRRDVYGGRNAILVGTSQEFTDDDDDQGAFVVGVGLEYLMGPRTSIDLRYLRTLEFSSTSNFQMLDRVDLGFSHNITRDLVGRLSGFFEHADPSDSPSLTRFGAGMGLRYIFDENLDFYTDVDWSRLNTSRSGFDHSIITATLGATYYIR